MLRDVLGDHATETVLHEINGLYQQAKILGWKELRPWDEFFGAFKPPQMNWKHLEQRLTTNMLHYRSNYISVCGIVMCVQIIRAPVVLLTLVLIATMCTYGLLIVKGPVRVGDTVLSETVKRSVCAVVSIVLLAVTGTLEHLIWSILYCVALCGLHLLLRPRSVTSKTNRVFEEAKLGAYGWFGESKGGVSKDDDPENPPPSEYFAGGHATTSAAGPAHSRGESKGYSGISSGVVGGIASERRPMSSIRSSPGVVGFSSKAD